MERAPTETRAADGLVLRGERLMPVGRPKAVAVLGHAMWVNRRTLDRPRGRGLASTLCDAGIACFVFDLRGHGESGPGAREGARYTYDDFVRLDVPALVRHARAELPGRTVAVVGHSLTGHAAMIAAGREPHDAPDAIVGLASNLWLPRFEPGLRRRLAKGAALAAWASLRRTEVPILSVASEGDRVMARPEDVARFLRSMPRAPITRRLVTHRDVSPPPDHMGLVLDERCRPIWREVADWVTERATVHG